MGVRDARLRACVWWTLSIGTGTVHGQRIIEIVDYTWEHNYLYEPEMSENYNAGLPNKITNLKFVKHISKIGSEY